MAKKAQVTKKAGSQAGDAVWASLRGRDHESVRSDAELKEAGVKPSSHSHLARKARAPRVPDKVVG